MESVRASVPLEADCSFCAYLAERREYTILARDGLTATFVTREQRGISHLLVVTTRHVPTLLDVHDDEALALMVALRTAARAIDQSEGRPGISVWQNNGLAANQAIGHLHFHVAGTLPGGGTAFGDVDELALEDTEAIAARLRPYL